MINSKKLPKTTKGSSLRNGLYKPLFEIAKKHGEVDSPFETDRGCMRVHFSPQRVHELTHNLRVMISYFYCNKNILLCADTTKLLQYSPHIPL